jgi:hypothetical protein
MRFFLNFFFFGLLFYLIYLFFPEAFNTLVSWAQKFYDFLRDVFIQLSGKFQSYGRTTDHSDMQRTLVIPLFLLITQFKSFRN